MKLLPWGSPSFFVRVGLLASYTTENPLVLKYSDSVCNFKDVHEIKKR